MNSSNSFSKTSNKNIIETITNLFNKSIYYITHLSVYVYRFIKYVWYGLMWPIVFITYLILDFIKKQRLLQLEKLNKETLEEIEKNKAKESYKNKELQNYKNEKAADIIKKKNFNDYVDLTFSFVFSIPGRFKKWFNNISLIKNVKNQKDVESKTLLVDFGDLNDDEKLDKAVAWKYVAVNKKGKKITGYIEGYNRVEIQSYLIGEGLTVYSITTNKWIQLLHNSAGSSNVKIKNKDLIFFLSQLSTYLKAGIPLVESLNILTRQTEKNSYKKIFRDVVYDLTLGENFSTALENRGRAFPKLLVNMVKASELTGELPEALDDQVQYYTEVEEARKEMVSALTYPTVVFVFTIAVLTFVMLYVVPKFVDVYNSMESSEIPKFTMLVIKVSDFLKENIIWIFIAVIILILILLYVYNKIKVIRTMFQWVFMHIPVLKDIIIYNEVTLFSKTFSTLLSYNVFITDSMNILNNITNNEIYKMMILDTVANLARGEKISAAFKDNWAFPIPAYEMIVTGEKTGQLAEMMAKVSSYYQNLHKNVVKRIKALVEPILIVFLTAGVGTILLAVIIPMFNMYQQVQSLG